VDNTQNNLLDENQNVETQVQSNENTTLLDDPNNKEQNAFKTMQQVINSLRDEIKQLKTNQESQKEIKQEIKPEINNTQTQTNPDLNQFTQILDSFKAEIKQEIGLVKNSVQEKASIDSRKETGKYIYNISTEYGFSENEMERIINNLDVSKAGLPNTLEGRIEYLSKYVTTPQLIELELKKNAPSTFVAALERKQNRDAKLINKQQSATIRAGEYNQNINQGQTSQAQKIVKEFMDSENKRVELKVISKAY